MKVHLGRVQLHDMAVTTRSCGCTLVFRVADHQHIFQQCMQCRGLHLKIEEMTGVTLDAPVVIGAIGHFCSHPSCSNGVAEVLTRGYIILSPYQCIECYRPRCISHGRADDLWIDIDLVVQARTRISQRSAG